MCKAKLVSHFFIQDEVSMIKQIIPFIALLLFLSSCGRDGKKIVSVHPDGYFKEVYHVKEDSIKHGPYMKYFASGILADSCHYSDGKIHGERHIFSREGYLEIIETYVEGHFEGPYSTYYPNGQMKKIQHYHADKIQGEVKQFYENGNLKAIIQFLDNLENGPFKEYYENGSLHWEGFYEGGDFEVDTLTEYAQEGNIVRKLFCEKGICQTVWTPEEGYIQRKEIFSQ
jgi:antitoxin component YwqK of YwqJK toxin-antitoxin module